MSAVRGGLWSGPAVERFEREFAGFIGAPHAVAVPSGRAGLQFVYRALDLAPGSEVLCSAFGYPVVPHLSRALGYDVRFVDCELDTLGMDPAALERTISDRTRVVIATHLYGVPCRVARIAEIAARHGAILIEDCAHCFGASVAGRKAGAYGDFGYFSFETSKPINTMGGGMVTVRDAEAARRLGEIARAQERQGTSWLWSRLARTTFEAVVTHPLVFSLGVYPALRLAAARGAAGGDHDRFASGYQRDEVTMAGRTGRYTNYQARLGLDQMQRAAALLERRRAHAERLIGRLRSAVRFQSNADPAVQCNYMLLAALFPRMPEVARRLLQLGVDTKHDYMKDCSRLWPGTPEFPRAARAEREVLHLPAYPELDEAQIDRVAAAISQAVAEIGGGAAQGEPSAAGGRA